MRETRSRTFLSSLGGTDVSFFHHPPVRQLPDTGLLSLVPAGPIFLGYSQVLGRRAYESFWRSVRRAFRQPAPNHSAAQSVLVDFRSMCICSGKEIARISLYGRNALLSTAIANRLCFTGRAAGLDFYFDWRGLFQSLFCHCSACAAQLRSRANRVS